jgi:hypothetical protein
MKSQHKLLYLLILCSLGIITHLSGCSKATPVTEPEINPAYISISVDSTASSEVIRVY